MPGSQGTAPIRVLIADDHSVVRAGLRRILELEPDLRVVGEAADGAEAVEQARTLTPNVVLMDISMPRLNGLEATRLLRATLPAVRVVALTIHTDEQYVVEMARAGAWGYVLKDEDPGGLVRAIRSVAGGGVYIPPALVGSLVRALRERTGHREPGFTAAVATGTAAREGGAAYAGGPPVDMSHTGTALAAAPRAAVPQAAGADLAAHDEVAAAAAPSALAAGLTPREAEVLSLIAHGRGNRQIAEALVVSEKTVKNHVTSILRKLRLKDRTQAAVWAIRSGWLP